MTDRRVPGRPAGEEWYACPVAGCSETLRSVDLPPACPAHGQPMVSLAFVQARERFADDVAARQNRYLSSFRGPTVRSESRLNPVLRQLAAAFPSMIDAEDIGEAAGIRMERVKTRPRADMYWQQILVRAHDEGIPQIDAVLDEAMERSSRPGLQQAIQLYREQRDD